MPRFHHYLFAHRILPFVVFSDPGRFGQKLEANGMRFLRFLWESAADDDSVDAVVDPEGLSFEIHDTPHGKLVDVRLPEPEEPPEAHAVIVVLSPDPRVFTLERSTDPTTGEAATMICEWSSDGKHLNHGSGPELDGFLEEVLRHLVRQEWARAWEANPHPPPLYPA